MINSKDEIMVVFAGLSDYSDDVDPVERVLKEQGFTTEQIAQMLETGRAVTPTVTTAPTPEPASNIGTAEWVSIHYPYVYLFGNMPYRGFVASTENKEITRKMMDKLTSDTPEKYFEWGLRRIGEVADWKMPAAKALIERDPEKALILDITSDEDLIKLLPSIWIKAIEGVSGDPLDNFPGILHVRMKSVLRRIKEHLPYFYKNILEQSPDLAYKLQTLRPKIQSGSEKDPPRGSAEWMSMNYPKTYLRGVEKPGAVQVYQRDFTQDSGTAIKSIIDNDPAKYFRWGLRRQKRLYPYINSAASSLIQKNPYDALMLRVYKEGKEVDDLLPLLWNKVMGAESNREEKEAMRFPGVLRNHMASLAKEIKRTDREFYDEHIHNTEFATKEFGKQI